MSEGGLEQQLAALKREYADRLKVHVESLRQSWALRAPGQEAADLQHVQQGAHRLAGSAGTFGFPAVSDAAIRLEDYLDEIAASGRAPDPKEQAAITALIEQLAAAVLEAGR